MFVFLESFLREPRLKNAQHQLTLLCLNIYLPVYWHMYLKVPKLFVLEIARLNWNVYILCSNQVQNFQAHAEVLGSIWWLLATTLEEHFPSLRRQPIYPRCIWFVVHLLCCKPLVSPVAELHLEYPRNTAHVWENDQDG